MQSFSNLKITLFAAFLSGAASLPLLAQNPAPSQPFAPPSGHPDRPLPFHLPPNPLMEALDTNHDGILSADEIANAPASLKKLDKNGDGRLTEDELRPPPPGGRGGPPRGQPRPENPNANPAGFPDGSDPRLLRSPGPPPFAGRDPSAANTSQRAPAAVQAQRPPPRLEDDPVAARLDKDGKNAAAPSLASPPTLFDLLDANHDGTLSEEELRNAPAVLRQLDLKSITLKSASPTSRGDLQPRPLVPAN